MSYKDKSFLIHGSRPQLGLTGRAAPASKRKNKNSLRHSQERADALHTAIQEGNKRFNLAIGKSIGDTDLIEYAVWENVGRLDLLLQGTVTCTTQDTENEYVSVSYEFEFPADTDDHSSQLNKATLLQLFPKGYDSSSKDTSKHTVVGKVEKQNICHYLKKSAFWKAFGDFKGWSLVDLQKLSDELKTYAQIIKKHSNPAMPLSTSIIEKAQQKVDLKLAIASENVNAFKNDLIQSVTNYYNSRQDQPEYKHYFFGKGLGIKKQDKLNTANRLIQMLKGESVDLTEEQKAALLQTHWHMGGLELTDLGKSVQTIFEKYEIPDAKEATWQFLNAITKNYSIADSEFLSSLIRKLIKSILQMQKQINNSSFSMCK